MPRKTYWDNKEVHSRNHTIQVHETLVFVIGEETDHFLQNIFPFI